MSPWSRLDGELDAWRASGRRATLWFRDDDACRESAALRRLLDITHGSDVPVTLAVIPAALETDLVEGVARYANATIVQHGYAHTNYAQPGARSCELGTDRPVDASVAELAQGSDRLARGFGRQFFAALVPPWNRIDASVVARLPDAGFRGLSTFGPRAAPFAVPGLVQCNAHVDLIAWRRNRAFIGAEAAVGRLVAHLQARREGSVDPDEPTGVLTHHLVQDDAAWEFVAELVAHTRAHDTVAWLDAATVFQARDCGTSWLISARSA